jgi:hypothetical protein
MDPTRGYVGEAEALMPGQHLTKVQHESRTDICTQDDGRGKEVMRIACDPQRRDEACSAVVGDDRCPLSDLQVRSAYLQFKKLSRTVSVRKDGFMSFQGY